MSHFNIEFGSDVIAASDPETGEAMTRRVGS